MQETLTPLTDATPYILAAYALTVAIFGWLFISRILKLQRLRKQLHQLQRDIPSLRDALHTSSPPASPSNRPLTGEHHDA